MPKTQAKTPTIDTRRRQLIATGAAVAATGPMLFNVARAQGGPVKIGFPAPLTGPFSAEAQDQVRAAELAIKEFNAAGVMHAAGLKTFLAANAEGARRMLDNAIDATQGQLRG